MIRTHSELKRFDTFLERFRYLSLSDRSSAETFGHDRFVKQRFYQSHEWRQVRYAVIDRDRGCDLGVEGYEIHSELYIHHMNPITSTQLMDGDPSVLDLRFLITTTHQTHNAIHYGDENQLPRKLAPRHPGDTKLW